MDRESELVHGREGLALFKFLEEILDTASMASTMFMADLQLVDATNGSLRIVAQRGFSAESLIFFARIDRGRGTACRMAIESRKRVIAKIETDPLFGAAEREMLWAAGSRMVQSTPLFDLSGRALGVFSTHYRTAASMRARESAVLDSLARAARAALHAYGRRPAADPNSVSGFDVEVCELQARAHLLRARIEKLDDELNRIRRGRPKASIRAAN